jgi:hypothetical protein
VSNQSITKYLVGGQVGGTNGRLTKNPFDAFRNSSLACSLDAGCSHSRPLLVVETPAGAGHHLETASTETPLPLSL